MTQNQTSNQTMNQTGGGAQTVTIGLSARGTAFNTSMITVPGDGAWCL